MSNPVKIAVLVSGGGSNMSQLIEHDIAIDCVIADRPCKATTIASDHNIPSFQVARNDSDHIKQILQDRDIELVVLAGFLSILAKHLTDSFKVINIHPSLLPKYGGRGMYGINVHKAVLANGDAVSGCTVHYVNEGIDTGDIIAQSIVNIEGITSAETIQKLVIKEEWKLLPKVVKSLVKKLIH